MKTKRQGKKSNTVCFNCKVISRDMFKCFECGGVMKYMGDRIRFPKKHQISKWNDLEKSLLFKTQKLKRKIKPCFGNTPEGFESMFRVAKANRLRKENSKNYKNKL